MARNQAVVDRNDLNTAIVVGAMVVAWLVYDGIRGVTGLFATPDAVTVATRVPSFTGTAPIGDGAEATVVTAILAVPDVSPISVGSLVIAVVLKALLLVGVTVLGVIVCRRLMRGIVFDRANTMLSFWMSMGLLAAGLAPTFFENMGLNGVFAALDGEFDEQWALFLDGAPLFIAAIAVGVLVIVFRRGAALEKDAEGLV
jgi:hypothetical protein